MGQTRWGGPFLFTEASLRSTGERALLSDEPSDEGTAEGDSPERTGPSADGYRKDPVGFVRHVLNERPYHKQLEVLNGILYQADTGASWRSLPQDLPPWKIVHHYFRTWREEGLWEPTAATLAYMKLSGEAESLTAGGEPLAEESIYDELEQRAAVPGFPTSASRSA